MEDNSNLTKPRKIVRANADAKRARSGSIYNSLPAALATIHKYQQIPQAAQFMQEIYDQFKVQRDRTPSSIEGFAILLMAIDKFEEFKVALTGEDFTSHGISYRAFSNHWKGFDKTIDYKGIFDRIFIPERSLPPIREIAEGLLPPDSTKTHLISEIEALIQRHGYDAVSYEVAKYAPWRASALSLNPEQSDAITDDSTLARLHRRYLALLESVELPEAGLTTHEQAKAASLLSTTYQNLCKEQSKFGIEPLPKDPRVYTAERLKSDFYRNRDKDGQPTPPAARRPRGRPKKRPGPE